MKARLDEKVDRLRSQVMQFASDGIQVSLNIPDTGDVKETFGSVINTVVEQQDEIQDLTSNLEATSAQSAEAQKKLLAWTAKCVQRLKEDNERLQARLVDSNKQIKNLSYNMQGYVDQEAANDAEAPVEEIEFDEMPKLSGGRRASKAGAEPSALFPTEEGGEVDGSGKGLGFVPPQPKGVRRFSKYKSQEAKDDARSRYINTPANTIPADLRARWRWAIRKVMSQIRRKQTKTGFTRTRMEPQQTFAGRLDRVEAVMFNMQNDFKAQLKDMDKKINLKIDTTAERISREVSAAASKLESLTEDVQHRFESVREEISMVDTTMREFFEKVQQQSSGDTKKIKDTMLVLEQHLKDLVHMEVDALRSHVSHVVAELDQIELTAEKLLQKVEIVHTISTTLPKYDPSKPLETAVGELTDLLQVDAQLREARTELAQLESGVAAVGRNHTNVNQHVEAVVHHYSKESVQSAAVELILPSQLEDLTELQQKCVGADGHMKHVSSMIAQLNRMCNEHDKVLREKVQVFNNLSQSVRDVTMKSAELLAFKDDAAAQLTAAANVEAPVMSVGMGASKEMLEMLEKFEHDLTDLNFRVSMMEEGGGGFEEAEYVEEAPEEEHWVEPIAPAAPRELTYDNEPHDEIQQEAEGEPRAVSEVATDSAYQKSTVQLDGTAPASEKVVVDAPSTSAESSENVDNANTSASSKPASASSKRVPAGEEQSAKQRVTAPAPLVGSTSGKPRPTNRPGNGAGAVGNRKASSVGGLDAMEARLRPLIEKLVAASVEEKMLAMQGEGDEDEEEEQDGFSPIPIPSPVVIDGGTEGDGDGGRTSPPQDHPVRQPSFTMFTKNMRGPSSSDLNSAPPPRIRRELSRFEGNSGKMRTGSGSGKSVRMDASPYADEFITLKKENSRLNRAILKMEEERLSKDDVERMFNVLIHNYQQNEQKEESNHALHSMERRVENLTKEISAMRVVHEKAIADLQSEFSETLYRVVSSAAETMDADNKESFLSTRALCLGCGRNSLVRGSAESRPTSPSFFPQLSNHSLPGPEVYRGGFKLPVKNPLSSSYVLEGASSPNGKPRGVKSAGQRMQDAILAGGLDAGSGSGGATSSQVFGNSLELETVLPRVRTAQPRPKNFDLGETDEQSVHEEEMQQMLNTGGMLDENSQVTVASDGNLIIRANQGYQLNIGTTTLPKRETSAMKVVRSSLGRPEAEEQRPMYRKGFPGKKSMRAETAYAHERFDLALPNNMLLANKLHNPSPGPHGEQLVRPYSSQDGLRARILNGVNPHTRLSSTMIPSASSTQF